MKILDGGHTLPLSEYAWRQAVQPVDWRETAEASNDEFAALVDRMRQARKAGAGLVWFVGSQVLEEGLGGYLVQLLQSGWITLLAPTGAGLEYDVQAALTGWTGFSQRLPDDLPKLGMWQEIGEVTKAALALEEAPDGGLGERLGSYLASNPPPYPTLSILCQGERLGIPVTAHLTIGADEIHTHPDLDFRRLGQAAGEDFRIFCHGVSQLEQGVFLNVGSQVTGVEVFLKALSIVRNLGYGVHHLTTANFDWIHLGDYRRKVGYSDWDYYYRPRKNVVHRPTSLGGQGFHFEGAHQEWLPRLVRALGRSSGC